MSVVTKSAFAALCGVSCARVSQWLASGKLDGPAIVGVGHRARIDADIARAQLKERLDVSRWRASSRARLDETVKADRSAAIAAPTIEEEIKAAHLRRIELANSKAEAEARVASGRYFPAEDVRREVGAIAGSMIAVFEGVKDPQFADAVAANWDAPQPDVLRLLRGVWRAARARQSALEANPAAQTPDTASEAALGLAGRP